MENREARDDNGRERKEFRLPDSVDDHAQPPLHGRANGSAGPTFGLQPATVRHAYGFDLLTNQGSGQIIGIVDAYDDRNAEADLAVFDKQFNLPACTSSNGCFRKVFASGHQPSVAAGWSMEMALDIEWAHALAPQARIILVEAASNRMSDLLYAVDIAVRNGASVVSLSWGCPEYPGERGDDAHFSINGVTFTSATGDNGSGVQYPSASPFVVGIGGTSLTISGMNYGSEVAWAGSGGGQSSVEFEPLFQAMFPVPSDVRGRRGVPDVAFDGDPSTGFAIYDSVAYDGYQGWFEVGGTSAGAPQWAALFAIANSMRVASRKRLLNSTPATLYTIAKTNYSSDFHDISGGTNGRCGALCSATVKYDYVTGLGTPKAGTLIPALVSQP
jgi:subtilase family serine protease